MSKPDFSICRLPLWVKSTHIIPSQPGSMRTFINTVVIMTECIGASNVALPIQPIRIR